ncbi:MAG TPA: hypothetical protein DEV81_26035, partial [Cyanobacteria bacterium UBA11049]|nr:hypothetical protein [Cyanobacteria bacterium UBA11049]
MVLSMKQVVKSSIALFVLGCLLAIFFPACSGGACAALFGSEKVSALIAQLQGRCCIYKAGSFGFCEKMAQPYISIPWHNYSCANWAARCLGEMGKTAQEAVPALIQALKTGPNNYDTGDGPIPTRDSITLALGEIGDSRAVKPLIAAIYSQRKVDVSSTAGRWIRKPEKPGAAIAALGLMGPIAKEAVPHIIPFLKNPSLFRVAAKALGQIKDPRAIPALKEALKHPTDAALAAEALGEFGSQASPTLPILIKMIEESPRMEGYVLVIGAIRQISGNQDYLPAFEQTTTRGWIAISAITDKHKKAKTISLPDNAGVFYIALPDDEKLYVQLHATAANPYSET